ncbi:MAG TPA: Tex-like N-terminal domain-containing protein, partial [Geobacterales bacterium]|nr:Tex-like N-terminal domain-containing protein [Geobacterales bacterium]
MEQPSPQILAIIVEETGLRLGQVVSVAELLREGGTVPFIARYRKERTGELDEVAIRTIEERLAYLSELEERKNVIRRSIDEQGKLSSELATRIDSCRQKTELEDLYLPYKPKRRTKATIARERGLEPLADLIAAQEITSGTLDEVALPFVDLDRDVPDAAAALAGASHNLAERLAEDADSRGFVRRLTADEGVLCSRVDPAKAGSVSKFEMYYDYREPLKAVPSHRMLAMRRGEKEELLLLTIEAPVESIVSGLTSRLRHKQSIFGQLL